MAKFTYGQELDYVNFDDPRIELTTSGELRLSSHGLWIGEGTYTSSVLDIGSVLPFSEVFWSGDNGSGAVVDTVTGNPLTIEVRYHSYLSPVLNNRGEPWTTDRLPSDSDPGWGLTGSIPWILFENGVPISPVMVRYVQWRATIRGA
jgi:hypothetical protein